MRRRALHRDAFFTSLASWDFGILIPPRTQFAVFLSSPPPAPPRVDYSIPFYGRILYSFSMDDELPRRVRSICQSFQTLRLDFPGSRLVFVRRHSMTCSVFKQTTFPTQSVYLHFLIIFADLHGEIAFETLCISAILI